MHAKRSAAPAWVVIAAALAYCAWLGWHWLPAGYSGGELAGFVSRLWDVRRGLTEQGSLPWWTPYYMSGSSYGLHHAQGLYLVPALALSALFGPLVSVKLTALIAIFAGAVAMYYCARHFSGSEWGAVLAAAAWLLHPEQVIRAAGTEHLGISVFMPFVPLTWLLFARALESGKLGALFWCALAVAGSFWAHNKMAFVNALFLAAYFVFWVSSGADGWRERARGGLRSCALVGGLALLLGAFFIVPGLAESRHVKLFEGEPMGEWQKTYAFKSLLALADRDGVVTRAAMDGALARVNARGGARSQQEYDQVRRIVTMQTDSPEKYAGLALLGVLALTLLSNRGRRNRRLFWFLVGALLAAVMLGYGPATVLGANAATWSALMGAEGVPAPARLAAVLALAAAVAFLWAFWRRKLTTPRRRLAGAAALAAFLLLPAFAPLAAAPGFGEIRSPYVFYDVTAAFLGALLCAFFVSDVLRSRAPLAVGVVALLLLVDYAPYQRPAKDDGVPARTLANLRAAYGSLRADADAVKVYALSGRALRLLGPMLSGKPLVYEAFYNWMAPKGIGALNTQAPGEPALFDLLGARYIVFDKSDPRMAGAGEVLRAYRQRYAVHHENQDFVVFRNATARPYLGAFAQAARFEGDLRESVPLALALAARNLPLIHAGAGAEGPFAAVIRPRDGPAPALPARAEPVRLRVESLAREGNGAVRAVVEAAAPSWLVINESYYPYWRASLDGRDIPVYRAFAGLMAVRLPAGRQELVLRYSLPLSYVLAWLASGLALLAGLGACYAVRRRSSRTPATAASGTSSVTSVTAMSSAPSSL